MGGPQNYMTGVEPAARTLASIGWSSLLLFLAVSVFVWILIAWMATRRRGTLEEHAPIDVGGGERWVFFGGFFLPAVTFIVIFVLSIVAMGGFPKAHAAEPIDPVPELRVTGRQWWFDAEYLPGSAEQCGTRDTVTSAFFHAPTELHIPVGRPVDIELRARDVIHSFWIPKLHGKVDMVPGQVNHIRIQADRPGAFEGECGEYCGVGHARMRIRVVAEAPAVYESWRAAQRSEAVAPTAPLEQQGKRVFESGACPLCHTIRGTESHGLAGPDLTHLASRSKIAGATLDNTAANLERWVTHARSVKLEAQMPNLPQIRGNDLHALVAYLQALR